MDAPGEELRMRLDRLEPTEEDAIRGLGDILEELGQANLSITEDEEENPDKVLAKVEEWTSLLSYVVVSTYGPRSRMAYVGWLGQIPQLIRRITRRFKRIMDWVAQKLGADSWAISVQCPWGVAVQLEWKP
jgi:hypothetical protein